jgi:hypothetical protein
MKELDFINKNFTGGTGFTNELDLRMITDKGFTTPCVYIDF